MWGWPVHTWACRREGAQGLLELQWWDPPPKLRGRHTGSPRA